MLKKITIILVLSFVLILWATPVVLGADLQAEQLASVRPAKESASYTPAGAVAGEVNRVAGAKDFCSLYGVPAYAITDWFWGQEWYANYQDPEEYGCVDVWPFEVTTVGFNIVVDSAMSIEVQGYVLDADLTDPQCPVPGAILCQTPVYTVSIPAGHQQISLPMVDTCCVYDVYFAAIYILTDLYGSGADAVSEDDPNDTCRSYTDFGSGWEDLVVQYGWPGEMLLWSEGYTEPQNDCPTDEWPNHKMHFPQLPDLIGWDVNATYPKILADDWQCSETGWVTDIHFWGSWKNIDGDPYTDDYLTPMPWFILSIHENIPADADTPWSRPGRQVWYWDGEIPGTPSEPPTLEAWYDPNLDSTICNDHVPYWRYDFFVEQTSPPTDSFYQYKDSIYWLNVSAVNIPLPYQWGWKNSRDHFMDDAVYTDTYPSGGPWFPIIEPPRCNWFDVYFDSSGTPEDMGSTNYYGGGWYYYEMYDWWNMWFYDNPFVYQPKHIWLEFYVDLPYPDSWAEFAINWSTDVWFAEGEPGRPPLPGDGNEDLYIGREIFTVVPGWNTIDYWIDDYNPEWVSIDFRAVDAMINGWIWHECDSTSLDLAFVITGEEVPPDTGQNHYKTWLIELKPFEGTVFVQDQFMEDSLSLIALEFLSNPVKKVVDSDTFDIIRPDEHLTWYAAFGRDTLIQVEYVNQFESTTVVIEFVEYLLVPTQKEGHDPPENLDHYKAYRIKDPVEFPVMLSLEDQFDILYGSPEFIDSLKPIYFLTPALKNMEQPQLFDSVTHYVAYEISPPRYFPLSVNTWDQFGTHVLNVQQSVMLLVPTTKLKICLPPTIGCPADETQDQNGVYTTTTQWTANDGNPGDLTVELISVAVQPPLPPGISAANVNFVGPVPGPGLGVKSTWGTVTYTVSDHCQPGGSITLIATNNCPPPNNSATCTFNVTLTNDPPDITQPNFLEGFVDDTVQYEITGTDPNGDVINDTASIYMYPPCGTYSITRTSGHGTSTGAWQVTWYTDTCAVCDTHMVIHDLTDTCGATSYCTTWVHLSSERECDPNDPYDCDTLWVECGNMLVPPGGGLVTVDLTIANDESLKTFQVVLSYAGSPTCCDSMPDSENTVDKVFAGSVVPGSWIKAISIDHQAKTVMLGATQIVPDCLPPGKGHLATLTLFGDSCCTIELDTITVGGITTGFIECYDPTNTWFYPVCRIDTCHIDRNNPPVIEQPDFLEGLVDDVVEYTITGTDPDGDIIRDSASIDIQPGCGSYSITRTAGHGTHTGTWQVSWQTDGCTPCDTHMVIHDLTDVLGATGYCTTWVHLSQPESLYWKPPYPDYAPNGMPDIDQRQDSWYKYDTGWWTFCGPCAVANCFKWFDSKYNVPPGGPGDGNDQFPLVRDYMDNLPPYIPPALDDHDPWNVDHTGTPWNPGIGPPPATAQPFVPGPQPQPSGMPPWGELVERLAWYFDTDGIRTGYCNHSGTNIDSMQAGIDAWFESEMFEDSSTIADTLYERTWRKPTFAWVETLVEKCQDVILLLGFWYRDPSSGEWFRIGGHYVTVAGVNSEAFKIAFSDPFVDFAELGGPGRVGDGTLIPHPHGAHGSIEHNDEGNVSHDIYTADTASISPGGVWWLPDYPIYMDPYFWMMNFYAQNIPDEFLPFTQEWDGVSEIFTEVEYAIEISPWEYPPDCGDCNGDGAVNIADAVCMVNYLFIPGSPPPVNMVKSDVNHDGAVNIADVIYLINWLFLNGPPPQCYDP